MIKNSFIISHVTRFFVTLWSFFTNSVYYKAFNKVCDFFGKLLVNSGIYRLFTKDIKTPVKSIFGSLANGIFGFFYKIFHKPFSSVKRSAKESVIANFCGFMVKNWYKIPVKYYGLGGLVFSVVRFAVNKAFGGSLDILTVAAVIISVVMIFFDVSAAGFYEGCGAKKLLGMPRLGTSLRIDTPNMIAVTVVIALGAAMGIFTIIPYWYLAVAGIAGVSLVLFNPKIGVFIIMAFFPFMPTMAVLGVAILVILGMLLKYLTGSEMKISFDMADIAIALMCGAIVYGVVSSYSIRSSAVIAAVYLVFAGSTVVIRRLLGDKRFLNAVINSMIAVSAIVCVYGIYQMLSGQAATTWTDTEMFENMSGRICATFDNPNVYGEYLLILIPITLTKLLTAKNEQKTAFGAALVLQVINMVLTFSRGCWIGMVAAVAIVLMLSGRKLLSVLVLSVFALPFVIPEAIVERLMSVGNTADTSTSYRVYIWEGTMKMLKDYWLCGIGIGTDAFNMVYPRYALNAISAPHSHNLYLHIICEMGMVGVFAVASVLVTFFKRLANTAKNSKTFKAMAVAVAAAMGGYLIQGMFDNVWYNYRIYMFFFMTVALGCAIYDVAKEKADE